MGSSARVIPGPAFIYCLREQAVPDPKTPSALRSYLFRRYPVGICHLSPLTLPVMLNDDKTEFLIIGTRQQLSKISIQSIKIGQTEVSTVASARNLGTWFDMHLDMGTHITKICNSAFYYLYNIRHIRKYLSRESTEKLVHAFISSKLDYCNSLLYESRTIKLVNCNVL